MKLANHYHYLQLEISCARLLELLEQGNIVASDFHTLNQNSRNNVRNLLLRSINPATRKKRPPEKHTERAAISAQQNIASTNLEP